MSCSRRTVLTRRRAEHVYSGDIYHASPSAPEGHLNVGAHIRFLRRSRRERAARWKDLRLRLHCDARGAREDVANGGREGDLDILAPRREAITRMVDAAE